MLGTGRQAAMRGVRGCRWGRRCAQEEQRVGASVFWRALVPPSLDRLCRLLLHLTRGEMVTCVRDGRARRWGKRCTQAERSGGVGVSCEHWCFPLLVGCARHSETGSGGCWYSGCCCCSRVAKWSPACEVRAVAGGAGGAPMIGGVSELVSLANTCTYLQ